ncbi:winged helix-turn-helix transcriptional regulator [Candidatus Woesearchaeota archaeon]|nr:winged helix-turn-helix transcriptional regulator [Candidatus Woesearchaeota archaeon]
MKRENQKLKNKRKFYWFVAILCLIYGGVAFILFIQQSYILYVRNQFTQSDDFARNATQIASNRFRPNFRTLTIIPLVVNLFGALISILAGLSLVSILRSKESKELKKDVIESMVLPDEKLVIRELEKNNGELTQSELVRKTGLSKVKVHRIVKRLESLEIVSKYPYGVTNKIKLEKSLYEE